MTILYTKHVFSTTKCLFITNRGFSNSRYLFRTTSCLLNITRCLFGTTRYLFSTSVELESENVCVSVCLSVCHKNFGAAWRLQKWSDFAEIWCTCSLGEYLEVFFFSSFENFDFWGLGTSFSPKRGWQSGGCKNCLLYTSDAADE